MVLENRLFVMANKIAIFKSQSQFSPKTDSFVVVNTNNKVKEIITNQNDVNNENVFLKIQHNSFQEVSVKMVKDHYAFLIEQKLLNKESFKPK